MCTLSIIAVEGSGRGRRGLRVVVNRDEHRERSNAYPPRWHDLPDGGGVGRRAIWPVDAHAGGTWIAAADHGLVLAVLNHYPRPPVDVVELTGLRSRGFLIPDLISEPTAEAVAARVQDNELSSYAPFRMIAAQAARDGRIRAAELRWDRTTLTVSWHAGDAMCFASSGLGDHRAAPRLPLFAEMVAEPGATPDRQDEFHRHTWPDRPEVSVMMSRTEARTVSVTRLEVMPAGSATDRFRVSMAYEPVTDAPVAVRERR